MPGPSDDTTNVMLRFESGATGLLFCSVATATTLSFTLFGNKGLAEFSKPNLARFRYVPISTVAPTGPVTAPPDEIIETPAFDMLNAELVEFARCIDGKRPYPVAIDQVLHGMAVFDAVVQVDQERTRMRRSSEELHGKTDHHRRRRLAHVLPAQQPLPDRRRTFRASPSNTSTR